MIILILGSAMDVSFKQISLNTWETLYRPVHFWVSLGDSSVNCLFTKYQTMSPTVNWAFLLL